MVFDGHMDADKVDRAFRTIRAGTSQFTSSDSTVSSALGTLSLSGKPWVLTSPSLPFSSLSRARAHFRQGGLLCLTVCTLHKALALQPGHSSPTNLMTPKPLSQGPLTYTGRSRIAGGSRDAAD